MDPKFLAQNGRFVITKKVLSQHVSYLCRDMVLIFIAQLLSWPAVSYRDIFSCYLF